MGGWVNGWMGGWVDRWMGSGWLDGWVETHGHTSKPHHIDYGNPMGFSWNTHVFSMAILKKHQRKSHVLAMGFHGFSIEDIMKPWSNPKSLWKLHGIDHEKFRIYPWIFYGTDHGSSMEFHGH